MQEDNWIKQEEENKVDRAQSEAAEAAEVLLEMGKKQLDYIVMINVPNGHDQIIRARKSTPIVALRYAVRKYILELPLRTNITVTVQSDRSIHSYHVHRMGDRLMRTFDVDKIGQVTLKELNRQQKEMARKHAEAAAKTEEEVLEPPPAKKAKRKRKPSAKAAVSE